MLYGDDFGTEHARVYTMKKNEEYVVEIEDIGNDGEGIGHLAPVQGSACAETDRDRQGFTVFVKDAIVGDVARVKILKAKNNYAYGRLVDLITPSPYRVEAVCPNARRCGGCSIMEMDYERQLAFKKNKVIACLERIGGLTHVDAMMEEAHGMEEPYHFRNKMQFPVGLDKDNRVLLGFYAGRTHFIINLEQCAIGHPVNDYLVKHLRIWLQDEVDTGNRRFIYDEEQHKGLVRHILTRVGFTTGELMVCVVVNGNGLGKSEENLIHAVRRGVEEYNRKQTSATGDTASSIPIRVTSISVNFNKEKTNRILGDTCRTISGQDYITDYIGDIKFHISPLSFFQVNPVQTKALYKKALEYAGLTGGEIVWDMYCGIGTISLSLARAAKKVYGVEIVPQAIEDARENARINGMSNVEFFCGKAEEVVPLYLSGKLGTDAGDFGGGRAPDVIVVDPPRKGCDSVLLDTIVAMNPTRLVYVSCDPATLGRDVKILTEKGFRAEKVAVYDQFCHSGHVESIVLMSKVNK